MISTHTRIATSHLQQSDTATLPRTTGTTAAAKTSSMHGLVPRASDSSNMRPIQALASLKRLPKQIGNNHASRPCEVGNLMGNPRRPHHLIHHLPSSSSSSSAPVIISPSTFEML